MSNFLANLAAKSLGAVRPVQPRLLSRFEAGGLVGAPGLHTPAPAVLEQTGKVEASAPPARRLTMARADTSQTHQPPAMEESPKDADALRLPTIEPARTVVEVAVQKLIPPESTVNPPQPSADTRPDPGQRMREARPTSLSQTPSQESAASIGTERTERVIERETTVVRIEASAAQQSEDSGWQPSVTVAPAVRETAPVAPVQPHVVRESVQKPGVTEPARPVIQVTIGRIDIRAVTMPEPVRRTEPAVPAGPSLNDYLRERSEGHR
jgi:hypothetical protein